MRPKTFAILAVAALGVGVTTAEIQSRIKDTKSQPQGALATFARSPAQISKEMVDAISKPRDAVIDSIRADCKYRHPAPDDWNVRDSCVVQQRSLYDQMYNLFATANDDLGPGVIIFCMDQNKSLNGFDWQTVSWCYERNLVAMKTGS